MTYYFSEYGILLSYFILCVFIAIIIVSLSYIINLSNPDTHKLAAYECGFNPYDDARNVFDIQFYIVAILFLVFDIEIMFLLPWSVSISFLNSTAIWGALDFIFELLIGYIYIYIIGALEWK